MISELGPYLAYKNSGVGWLRTVPEHWAVTPVKQRYTIQLGKMLQKKPNSSSDFRVPYLRAKDVHWFNVRTADASKMWSSRKDVEQFGISTGDLLVCEGGEGGRCGILRGGPEGYIIQNALHRVRPCEQDSNEFLQYVLHSVATTGWFKALNSKATIAHFTKRKFGALSVPIPPVSEQHAIVRYLDHADRRIRRYIRAKERLIELLEEQKRAIIHQAVTGKIDVRTGQPYPVYKDAGAEWLGKVPAHWETRRLKWVTRLQRGYDLPADRRVPGPFPVVSSGGIIDTHSESRCTGPGVVMGRYGSTDSVYYLERDFWPHNTSLFVTNFQGNRQKWCYYLLTAITKEDHASKSAVPGLDRKDLFQVIVPVPPLAEQIEAVKAIEVATRTLTAAISTTERKIVLIREYRTRLIADVVTGKLDVRDAAVHLPELNPIAGGNRVGTIQAESNAHTTECGITNDTNP